MPDCSAFWNLVAEMQQARSALAEQLNVLDELLAQATAAAIACEADEIPPPGAGPEPLTLEELREKARPFLPNGGGQPM